MARTITHASLFSGIGAPELAATWMGWTNLFHCEINPFCRAVLNYWYPNSASYDDIKTTNFTMWQGQVDVLTGGFPCQPFSAAGRRKGTADDRYLWPEMLRVIGQVQPAFVIAENVDGILSMVQPGRTANVDGPPTLFGEGNDVYRTEQRYVADLVCEDLEKAGYAVQPVVIPACGVGAPHRRYRVWFIAQRRDGHYSAHTCNAGVESVRKRQATVHAPEPSAYTSLGGNIAHEANNPTKRERRENDGQQGQRREPPQRADGLPALPFSAADAQRCGGNELDADLQSRQSDGAWADGFGGQRPAAFSHEQGWISRRSDHAGIKEPQPGKSEFDRTNCPQGWWRNFPTVAAVCDGNDGLSSGIPGLTLPFRGWRKNAIAALGNSMVPQVVMELFRAIEVEIKDMQR